jgi:hypothetical protein
LSYIMPALDRITLYPVKSLDGVAVAEARVLPSGGLENDRRWRLVDLDGRVVNAKRTAAFHPIRAEYDLAAKLISLFRWADPPPAEPREFSIGAARFLATNVCKRCLVPSRESRSGGGHGLFPRRLRGPAGQEPAAGCGCEWMGPVLPPWGQYDHPADRMWVSDGSRYGRVPPGVRPASSAQPPERHIFR